MHLSPVLIAMLPLVVTSVRGGELVLPHVPRNNTLRGTTNGTLSFDERNGNSSLSYTRALLGTCGNGNRGNGVCPDGANCCSVYGWCGTGSSYCSGSSAVGTCGNGNRGNGACADGSCCSVYGWCGTGSSYCSGSSGGSSSAGTCGNGNRGNGACADGSCCSVYGWCGTGSSYCSGPPAPSPVSATPPASGSLYSGSGSGTYYYDVTGQTCNGAAPYAENNGYPTCTSFDLSKAKVLKQYNTNNIVAIDNTMLSTPAGRANLCGKQIHVYKNGVEVSGGPFVVFDGCAACVGGGRIDFSVSALNAIDNGRACNDGVVPGISWKVTKQPDHPICPLIVLMSRGNTRPESCSLPVQQGPISFHYWQLTLLRALRWCVCV